MKKRAGISLLVVILMIFSTVTITDAVTMIMVFRGDFLGNKTKNGVRKFRIMFR